MIRIPVRERKDVDEDKERFTSKDLTKFQLFQYIFEDFFKGFFIFGFVFLDGMVLLYFIELPYVAFLIPVIFVVEFVLVYLEAKLYMKYFSEKAIENRYRKKKD